MYQRHHSALALNRIFPFQVHEYNYLAYTQVKGVRIQNKQEMVPGL